MDIVRYDEDEIPVLDISCEISTEQFSFTINTDGENKDE